MVAFRLEWTMYEWLLSLEVGEPLNFGTWVHAAGDTDLSPRRRRYRLASRPVVTTVSLRIHDGSATICVALHTVFESWEHS